MPITPQDALKLTSLEESLVFALENEIDLTLSNEYTSQKIKVTYTPEGLIPKRVINRIMHDYLDKGWDVEFLPPLTPSKPRPYFSFTCRD